MQCYDKSLKNFHKLKISTNISSLIIDPIIVANKFVIYFEDDSKTINECLNPVNHRQEELYLNSFNTRILQSSFFSDSILWIKNKKLIDSLPDSNAANDQLQQLYKFKLCFT